MKIKTILWINPSFLDYRIPLYQELNELSDNNFHLIYSCNRIPSRCNKAIKEKLKTNAHGLEHERIIKIGNNKNDFANKSLSIPFPKGLYQCIKDVKPDVILSEGFFQFTPWAVIYSLIHHKSLYIAYERTAHTERFCPLWRRLYRKFINLFVSGYIVNGKQTKDYLISQGVKSSKIQTGGMCADSIGLASSIAKMTDTQKKELETQILGKDQHGFTYIIVGQMIARKGVNYAIEGWLKHIQQYPNDRLLIVGDGPLLDEYQSIYGNHQSIVFIGGIDYSQIYKYYAISDVFVIATLEDNWSLVVPEAMACGLPIACSIYNGCHPELVKKDINGITFDPLDEKSLVHALGYFHAHNIIEMGKNSIIIEKEFNPSHVAQNIIKLINA